MEQDIMSALHVYDISRAISAKSVVYPGDDALQVEPLCSIDPSCPCNITRLGWTTHFLTHVDPPLHFVEHGASLDDVPLERFIGDALVVEVAGDFVSVTDIPSEVESKGISLLFKTRNSAISEDQPFETNHVYISGEAAEAAAARGVNLMGIDYMSVDRFGDDNYPAHRALLSNNVLILEGLNLTGVPAGRYTLVALPLKIAGGDGSPVRAVLLDRSSHKVTS